MSNSYPSKRPEPAKRTFRNDAVDRQIEQIKAMIKDPELAWLFENCYPNTLDTTVDFGTRDGKPDTFVITGDIDAMWLRDSSAQVQPYLPLCAKDKAMAQMIAGLIHRQTTCILLDPYANAFYKDGSRISKWHEDHTVMKPGVHERKWELDSLCYCIRLAHQYWKITGDTSVFDSDWKEAMKMAVDTMIEQQRKEGRGSYSFVRDNTRPIDTVSHDGWGAPIKPNGMICSAFRNSDDATEYLFNIPENLFAVSTLRYLAEILDAIKDTSSLAATCLSLADEVEQAINSHGLVDAPNRSGKIYAYECDGLGNFLLVDDPGMPSLASIPYLGYKGIDDPLYQRSRDFAHSSDNPFFQRGVAAEGTSSPHVAPPFIWPMGIIGRGLTSKEDDEILLCLAMLKRTHAGTGFMHESFHKDDPHKFTRKWFAWVNTLFGELIVKISKERPHLLEKNPI